jgi:hypothetical protein
MSQNLINSLAFIKANSELSASEQIESFRRRTGASLTHVNGTHVLRYCGIVGTATSGSPTQLLASWSRAANKKLKKNENAASREVAS